MTSLTAVDFITKNNFYNRKRLKFKNVLYHVAYN